MIKKTLRYAACLLFLAVGSISYAQISQSQLEMIEKEANSGDADAQHYLALVYVGGQGIPTDYDKARHYFELAAEKGHVTSLYNLGIMYHLGYGVERNNSKAQEYFTLSCAKNYRPACEMRR